MKYLRMLGLAAVAAAALTAFVGTGTAMAEKGVLCSTHTTPCTSRWTIGTVMDWSLKPGTTAKLVDTSNNTLDSCTTSTVQGKVTSNPNGTGTAEGPITSLTWGIGGSCTVTTDTVKMGGLKVKGISGTDNGTLVSTGTTEVTVNVFSSCNYGVEAGTSLGTVKGGSSPTFTANAVAKKLNGGFLCPETTKWTAEYVLNAPTTDFWVEPS